MKANGFQFQALFSFTAVAFRVSDMITDND